MPPKAKKSAAPKDNNPEQIILEYLTRQNRPYAANDVFNNLHGAVGKTAVTKALTTLADSGEITKKQFGKFTLFVARQDLVDPPSQEELDQMDTNINELKENIANLKEQQKSLLATQQSLNSSLTLEDAIERISVLRKKNEEMEIKIQDLQNGTRKVDPQQKKEVDKIYEIALRESKKRKKLCMEIVNMICDASGQRPNDLFEELGLEQDS